jgi:tRNA threonylcarbamoyladenosine biosynthesis protein TsaE
MHRLLFTANTIDDTERLGIALAELLPPGTTIALCGTLGAGKTRLVQAIAAASGVNRADVVSPTFVLCHEYHGRRTIYHLDAYRLKDDDEFLQLGPEEYFESAGLTVVEWADRVADCLPTERLEINITVTGDTSREFELIAHGSRLAPLVAKLDQRLRES